MKSGHARSLIRRFVDPAADHVAAVASREGAIPVYQDDHELLERELPVYDALHAYCRGRLARAGS